jgi:uncharacterized membrane protein
LPLDKPSLSFAALRATVSALRGGGAAFGHFLDLSFATTFHAFVGATSGASAHHGINVTATARCGAILVTGFAALFLLSREHTQNTKSAVTGDITNAETSGSTGTNKSASQPAS